MLPYSCCFGLIVNLDQRKVICISVMLNTSNRCCNALQCIIGIFLHAANAPDSVHGLMARMGLAISTTTMHNAINNLTIQAKEQMRTFGQTMHVLYSFDNVDIYLRHATLTVSHGESLIHLTSAISFPLNGIATPDDLCYYTSLRNRVNPVLELRKQGIAPVSPERLLELYREPVITHPFGLQCSQRFYIYTFLRDLIKYGPPYFSCFRKELQELEAVEQIPLVKAEHKPLATLDINPSTVSGNADVLTIIFVSTASMLPGFFASF